MERACTSFGVNYIKQPVPYESGDYDEAVNCILAAPRPVLFHCFHGRDRTGVVARRVRMRSIGRVVLYQVGRNLNRAVRTCEAFGIRQLGLAECTGRLGGNLYGASGRVELVELGRLPTGAGVLALETGTRAALEAVCWDDVDTLLVGGESSGLPRSLGVRFTTIDTCGRVSGLTVEAALAVALHEWRRPC